MHSRSSKVSKSLQALRDALLQARHMGQRTEKGKEVRVRRLKVTRTLAGGVRVGVGKMMEHDVDGYVRATALLTVRLKDPRR